MDPRFRQSFAEALAKALREKEEALEQQSPEEEDALVRSTFEQLHFDQPTGLTARGCRLLGQALIRADRPQYSLSDRLVSGLEQALDRYHAKSRSGDTPGEAGAPSGEGGVASASRQDATSEANPTSPTGDGIDENESLLRPLAADTEENLAASLAHLAWTVHGRIPLHILCYNAPAEALLGSYREAPPPQATDPNQLLEALPVLRTPEAELSDDPDLSLEHSKDDGDGDGDGASSASRFDPSGARPTLEHDADDEVWAAESDPSDYDYGENDLGSLSADDKNDLEPSHWVTASSAPSTPMDVARAIASLVSKITFRNLADLPWSNAVDEELTQLALVLLLARNHRHGSAFLECFEEEVWQRVALHPVHAMRDAAACHPSTRLPSYLQLLQAMIQVHEVESPVTANSTKSSPPAAPSLPPATWLSLSLLSSLCSTTCSDFRDRWQPYSATREGNLLQHIHSCVVDSMDSLVDIFDALFHPSKGAAFGVGVDASDGMLSSLFVPMFRLLAIPLQPPSKHVQSFQLLLNSGFFRQLLHLWQTRHDSLAKSLASSGDDTLDMMLRDEVECLECALLELCLASPNLLGKYAWRYPGFAAAVTEAEAATGSCVSLEWNLLGMQLSSASSANLVQWKASSSLSTEPLKQAPPKKECQAAARALFQRRFQLLGVMVGQWKRQRGNEITTCSDSLGVKQNIADRQVLADFDAMLSRFVLWPVLVGALRSLEQQDDLEGNCWTACESFLPIQRLLATFPKQPTTVGDRPKSKLDDVIDHLDQEHSLLCGTRSSRDRNSPDAPPLKLRAQDAAVETLRRSLKTLQSLLEVSAYTSAEHRTSSGQGMSKFSSKAD